MHCLVSLRDWNYGFESPLAMDVYVTPCIYSSVQVGQALRQTIPWQCYQMSTDIQKNRKWEVSGHIGLSIVKIILKLCFIY